MASKRHVRRKACTGKIRYDEIGPAIRVARLTHTHTPIDANSVAGYTPGIKRHGRSTDEIIGDHDGRANGRGKQT